MARELAKVYSHREVEERWYAVWSEAGYFQPRESPGPAFSMVIPPPNVTGSLHMGHALNNTLQDILCRYRRMGGLRVLWVPGTDHAGIATQNVVERKLAEEGLSRADLGREKFVERVWSWRAEAGSTILHQLRALGVSCDWSRERFTMDEGLSLAVREAFIRLWEGGLLYRALKLINWCPRCKTALADIEVVHEEAEGRLWHIRYPLWDDPGQALVVATTRPETMLGDTAVAVHPEDERYRRWIGKRVRLPIVGRSIPVVADSLVDPEFGTGALKITPGHDFNDFEVGERHGLDRISIFDEEAKISPPGFTRESERGAEWLRRYEGKDRNEARRMVIGDLKAGGLLEKEESYRHALGRCYRCLTVIEPFLTPQWFVKIQPLADPAIKAVKTERVRIVPEGWANSYFAWMENIKDWCVSRQIWWGHQIPAWYCRQCNQGRILEAGMGELRLGPEATPTVLRESPERCSACGGKDFIQDPDVLDTWFSSALWPFSTLGWPEKTEDLKLFYPTSVLITGFDILFFWVARMIMMGMEFMGDVPFRHVYIHALVRDQEGQKMSKSKGNVIDPLEVMDRYGTDAFRFTLASLAAMGRDIKLSEERIAGYQNFVNKLWNASRFVLLNWESSSVDLTGGADAFRAEKLNFADRWILSRLHSTILAAREAIEAYRFNEYAHVLYQFTWHEFCDWYIEMSKLSLNGTLGDDGGKTRQVLAVALDQILRLSHPVMPFVTEEIWQYLHPGGNDSIMVASYPEPVPGWKDDGAEERTGFLTDVVRAVRNLRTELGFPPSKEASVMFFGEEAQLEFLRAQEPYLRFLARVNSLSYATNGERPRGAATAVVGTTEVYVPVADGGNLRDEGARLAKEIEKLESEFLRARKKLSNQNFLSKAKEEIVEKEKRKAAELEEKMKALRSSLERIREILNQIG